MGLDMYLAKCVNGEYGDELMYWRKANAIHAWFVQNVQGGIDSCHEYPVTLQQLINLMQLLEGVIWGKLIGENTQELLPTQSGFFFGSTEYDEWYWRGLLDTLLVLRYQIRKIQDEFPQVDREDVVAVYQSSW